MLTNDLVVAVPYGHAEHGADVKVRELVGLKSHLEEFSAHRQLFSVCRGRRKKKKKTLWEASSRWRRAAAHFSKWLHFLASYTFSICLSRRLTVDHVNICSLDVARTAALAIVGLCLDEQSALRWNLSNQFKKLQGYEVLHVV